MVTATQDADGSTFLHGLELGRFLNKGTHGTVAVISLIKIREESLQIALGGSQIGMLAIVLALLDQFVNC